MPSQRLRRVKTDILSKEYSATVAGRRTWAVRLASSCGSTWFEQRLLPTNTEDSADKTSGILAKIPIGGGVQEGITIWT